MAEEESLKNKTKKGLFWSALERFGTQGISAIFAIFLARLLSPDDYGLVAMPMVFLSLALCFVDSGFGSALIRKPDLKEEDITTTFYFNIIAGVVCYGILFFTSPLIADFYEAPILTSLLKVSALGMLIGSFCTVQQALLNQADRFQASGEDFIVRLHRGRSHRSRTSALRLRRLGIGFPGHLRSNGPRDFIVAHKHMEASREVVERILPIPMELWQQDVGFRGTRHALRQHLSDRDR